MPTFNTYPASQVRAPDVWGAMQQGREGAQMNQLRQMQMETMQADRQTQAQSQQRDRALEQVSQIADLLTPFADPAMPAIQKAQMWPQMLQRAQAMGLLIDKAPTQYDPQFVAMTMAQAGKYQAAAKTDAMSPEAEAQKIRISKASRAAEKPLAIERKLRLAGIDPNSEEGQKFIRADLAGQQISFEQDADGNLRVLIGKGVGGGGMEKKTRGNIEKSLVSAREGLARLRDIQSKYRPEFQEIPTRIGVAWTGLKARFGAGDVSSEDRSALTEFADYRRTALSNINLYIKEITGAQMSIQEADRLRKALPDPGEGIFGGDDPITFKAHMDSVMADLEKSVARFNHYLTKGITDSEEIARLSPLGGMRIITNDETRERFVEVDQQWVPM